MEQMQLCKTMFMTIVTITYKGITLQL